MNKLQKLNVGNAPPPTKNNKLIVVDDYNILVDKINEIVDVIYQSGYMSTYTLDLLINVAEYTISGALFSQPLTKQPILMRAVMSDGTTITDISNIIQGAVLNNGVYDIVITPLEDNYSNVTISIL